MASHWPYCCRLGSQDPRGSLAATRVLGDKRCHGTHKYAKKRQWHHTTEAALDAFWGLGPYKTGRCNLRRAQLGVKRCKGVLAARSGGIEVSVSRGDISNVL